MRKLFFAVGLLSLLVLSCRHDIVALEEQPATAEQAAGEGAEFCTLRIALADSSARMVAPDFTASTLYYRFSYLSEEDASVAGEFPPADTPPATLSALNDYSVTVATGTYTFALDAFQDSEGTKKVLASTKEGVVVTASTTEITFELKTLSDSGGTGDVSVTLSYPTASVVTVTAKLCALSDLSTAKDTQTLEPQTNGETSTVVYEKSGIPSGSYLLFVTLTDILGATTTIPELVIVEQGAVSSNAGQPLTLTDEQANATYVLFVNGRVDDDFGDNGTHGVGSDTNDGRTSQTAFATLQKAIDSITTEKDWHICVTGSLNGATVIPETFVARSLTIEGMRLNKGGNGAHDVLQINVWGGQTGVPLTIQSRTPTTIKGMAISRGTTDAGLVIAGSGAVTLLDSGVSNNTRGISISGNADVLIERSWIAQNPPTDNSAPTTQSEKGGGIYKTGSGALTIVNSTVEQNAVSGNGGGIYASAGTVTLGNDAYIKNNTATTDGGGVYNAGTLTMEQGTVSKNSARHGAGIYSTNALTVTGGTITENTADSNAGGMFINGGTATLAGGSIINNTANSANGGGVLVKANTTFTMTGGEIRENTAGADGGGVYVEKNGENAPTLFLSGGTITKNTANNTGGGVFNDGGTVFMYGSAVIGDASAIEKKTAAAESDHANVSKGGKGGAGLYNNGGKVYLGYSDTNTSEKLNGGIFYNYAYAKASNGNGGGGVYNAESGVFIMRSGTIGYNGTDAKGGAFFNSNSPFTLEGGKIIGNNSTGADGAGAVYNGYDAEFVMTGGEITANTGRTGGGVRNNISGDGRLLGTFTMSGGTISHNTATEQGGGVYNAGTFKMSGNAYIPAGTDGKNDVYLWQSGDKTYTITLDGTFDANVTTPIATITPDAYSTARTVLTGTKVSEYAGKFAVTDDSSGQGWTINSAGLLE